MTQVPAGWYPSPDTPGQLQYWDGNAWTDFRAVAQAQAATPTPPAATPVVAATPVAAAPPVAAAAPTAPAPVAAAPAAAGPPPGAARRARLIAFAGGAGLFILGFLIGRIS